MVAALRWSALCSDDIPIIMADDVVCRRRGSGGGSSGGADGHRRDRSGSLVPDPEPVAPLSPDPAPAGVAPCFSEPAGEWDSTCQLVELAWLIHLTCRLQSAEPSRNRPFHLARLRKLRLIYISDQSYVYHPKQKHHQFMALNTDHHHLMKEKNAQVVG